MGFHPQLWADKTLNEMKKELENKVHIFSTITDYTPMVLNKAAEGYNGLKIGGLEAVDLPAAESDVNKPVKSKISFMFDQKTGVLFDVEEIDEAQSNVNLMQHFSWQARDKIFAGYDKFCVQQMLQDATTKLKKPIGNKVVYDTIVALSEQLDNKEAPAVGRFLVVSPTVKSQLLKIPEFISRDKITDTNAVKEGWIGRILGFDVIMRAGLQKVDEDGDISAVANENDKDVILAYQSLGFAFGRQQELKAMSENKTLTPAVRVNVWSVYGGTMQEPDYVVTMRDN